MQQPNCYSCNKPTVIHAIKYSPFFFPRTSQPPSFSWTHQNLQSLSSHFFILKKGIYLFLSVARTLSLSSMDPLRPPLLCSLSTNPVTFGSCISTSTSSIGEFIYMTLSTSRFTSPMGPPPWSLALTSNFLSLAITARCKFNDMWLEIDLLLLPSRTIPLFLSHQLSYLLIIK